MAPEGLEETTSVWHNMMPWSSDVAFWGWYSSAGATAEGLVKGATFFIVRPNWSEPSDAWAGWSRGWGIASGASLTVAVVGARTNRMEHTGGYEITITKHIRIGWRPFRPWSGPWKGRTINAPTGIALASLAA